MEKIEKKITKKSFEMLITQLMQTCQVIAPSIQDGIKLYKEIASQDTVNLYDGNTLRSPKEHFFPVTEPLFSFRKTKRGVLIETKGDRQKKRALVGVRPCDAHALTLLDAVFKWDYEDQNYLALRENTLIIGLTCYEPDPYCFCTTMNLSPFDETGSDILLTELDDEYYVKILTEKGKNFYEEFKGRFDEVTPALINKREKLASDIIAYMPAPLPLAEIKSWLDENFEHPLWEKIAQGCIGCGSCAYLCPTCHCFDLVDESQGYTGKRHRNWDSCAFNNFTQMAAHQPRQLQWQRFRQRIMHKFKYFVDRFSHIACVGCGRCRALCPAEKDILDIIKTLHKEMEMSKAEPLLQGKGMSR